LTRQYTRICFRYQLRTWQKCKNLCQIGSMIMFLEEDSFCLSRECDVIEQSWHHHDYTSIASGIISQYVANVILQGDKRQEVLNRGRTLLRENVPIVEQWIASHGDRFRMISPKAGGMAFIGYNLDINSGELVTRLRREKSVLLVAGDWFGMDGYLRLGIGGRTEELIAGLELVDEFLIGIA
ncbi:MAG: hypothetical protein AAF420_15375, partial [Pseudomonadota bacterium]